MSRNLRVLIVEDSENDAVLLEVELERAGYKPDCLRVETAETLQAALDRRAWDLVIADYVMPHFNGLSALALVREKGLDLPFIIVSGHISDDTAVAAMKAGAHDYVMKDNLVRLGPAVERELREAEVRRERRQSEEQLKLEHTFRQAIENSVPSGIAAVDLQGRQTYVNPSFCAMVGWTEKELVGAARPFLYWPPEEVETIGAALGRVIEGGGPAGGLELRFCRRSGERFDVLLQVTPLKDSFDNVTGWVGSASDITARKRAEARLAAEHAITRILANAASVEQAAPGIVQVLLESLEVEIGVLWLTDAGRQLLQPFEVSLRIPSEPLLAFLEQTRRLSFAFGVSLPGRVWKEGRAVWVTEVSEESWFERAELASETQLRSAIAFPIQSGDDFFGALEFLALRRMEPDSTLSNMMTAIGSEIGQFIKRRSAEEELRRAHDELELRVQQRTADLKTANSKLQAAISERKRLEHELLDITEKERRRIGLDLHDDLGQKLSGLALMTRGLQLKLAKQKAAEAKEAAKIHSLIQQAMSHAHDLAHDLASLDLKENDLGAALDGLAAHVREFFDISCRFKLKGPIPPLEAGMMSQLYKITQEAVTNAIKHGKAKRVAISLANSSGKVILKVENDGLPFPDLRSQSTGMGLRIMNYRASLIGGSLEIKGASSHGTLVTCSVPLLSMESKAISP